MKSTKNNFDLWPVCLCDGHVLPDVHVDVPGDEIAELDPAQRWARLQLIVYTVAHPIDNTKLTH